MPDIVYQPLPDTYELSKPEDFQKLNDLLNCYICESLPKNSRTKDERDFDSSDFPDVAENAVNCFQFLKTSLSKLNFEKIHVKLLCPSLELILKLCATHHQEFPWSNYEASSLHSEVLVELLKITNVSCVEDLLCKKPYTLFKNLIQSMKSSLTKDTWTKNPSSCQVFKWFLIHVKFPHLIDYLTDVLPPSLLFMDHHAVRNKILGTECLTHIIDNVPPSELKLYGRADVVYDALFHLTYTKEPEIIRILFPAILKLLAGQEKNLHRCSERRVWGRYDDVYHQILWYMEMENQILLRRAYSIHIPAFLEAMGITVLKHLKRHMRVLSEYLSVYDGDTELSRIYALKALNSTIRVAWPRMNGHCENILKDLMFLISDVVSNDAPRNETAKEELLNESRKCLLLLKAACPENFERLTSELLSIDKDLPGLKFLSDVCKNADVEKVIK